MVKIRENKTKALNIKRTNKCQKIHQNPLNSESGKEIPVRTEGDYLTYTDAEAKQLATGHDISPGTEKQWGLGDEVEHDPRRAHYLAQEQNMYRGEAAKARGLYEANEKAREQNPPADHSGDYSHNRHQQNNLETAAQFDKLADEAEEKAAQQYDADPNAVLFEKGSEEIMASIQGHARKIDELILKWRDDSKRAA